MDEDDRERDDTLHLPGERVRDETADRLYRQLEDAIAHTVSRAWLHGMATPDVHVQPSPLRGLAGSITAQATVSVRLFVKCHLTDIAGEQEGYDILRAGPPAFTDYLVPSLVTERGQVLWLTPHADAISLQTLACAQNGPPHSYEWLIAVYRDVLAAMERLWLDTRTTEVPPDLTYLYVDRIANRRAKLERGLGIRDLDDLTFSIQRRVNEVDHGAVRDLLSGFERQVRQASVRVCSSCTTHRDEHGNNIIVDGKAARRDPTAWWIVDYPNARRSSDWVFSIAKTLYGWRCLGVLELARHDEALAHALQASHRIEANHLIVTYNQGTLRQAIPPACRACERLVWELAARMGRAFEEERGAWQRRLTLAWFATLFPTAGLVFDDAPYMAPIIIGESLQAIKPLGRIHQPVEVPAHLATSN